MTNWIMVFLTVIIAFLTFLVWKVYSRIEWLTGAMETHSDIMLRIEAKRGINGKPIKLVAWDPTIETPPSKLIHGEEIDVSTIYCYIPPSQRKYLPTRWKRINNFLHSMLG